MDLSRVIIFGTTHILSDRPIFRGQKPVHVEVRRGRRLRTYSTGRLEEALALGLEVFVCSIRPAFGPADAWWRGLVDQDRVYNASHIFAATDGDAALAAAHEPWRQLYRRLRLHWPENRFTDIDDPAEWLFEHHGVRRGTSLRGYLLPS